jgi:RHS repeat-associated protein
MQALIADNTAMYVRDDTPSAEPRYRARFYFHPNSISMTSGNAHYIFVGRNTASLEVLRVEFRYYNSAYQIRTNIRNDSTGYSNSSWYTMSNAWHVIEIDWKASSAAGANNGYITLWIDGAQQGSVTGIDNDTRRVDEARLGPLSGIDTSTRGTEYFDAFESRRDTYIGPVALANFTASPISGTASLTVTFTNTSQPTATLSAYLWQFGDGYTSTITNPVHSYSALGNYTVTLTAWNGTAQDTLTKTRQITVTPHADFSGSPTSGRAPLAVTFSNASQPANEITSYLWKFGDGVTSTQMNPTHNYAATGEYTVTLTAYAGSGSNTLVRPRYITVTPGLGDPVALSADPSAFEGTPAIAYNPTNLEYLVVWREYTDQHDVYARRVLSDGTPIGGPIAVTTGSGDQQWPNAAYGAGVYLVVWQDDSTNTVRGQIIQANGLLSGTAVTIGSGGSNNAPAVDFNPVSGEFLVVWAYDPGGNNDIRAQRVAPTGQLLGTAFAVADQAEHELFPALAHDAAGTYLVVFLCYDSSEYGLCGQRVASSGSLTGSRFSVFDGDNSTSNLPNLAYDPLGDGYLVTWRETTGGSSEDIWVRAVSGDGAVLGAARALGAQTADPYGPAIADRGNGSYVIAWPDNRSGNWDVYGYAIDRDGTPLGAVFPIETTNADQVEAAISPQGANGERLIAYNDNRNGNADLWVERYDATGANFVAAPRSGIAPSTVIFTDTSTAPQSITNWLWNFGDGVTSTLQHPTHTYSTIGYFTVTLETWAGATHNTVVKPQYLATTPHADFTADPSQGETPLVVTFSNTSQPVEGITGYEWDFGDGVTATTASPVHTYTAYGPYTVTLTAFSNGGAHTLVQPMAVNAWPGRGEPVPIATQWWANEDRSAIAYNPDNQAYLAVWDEWTTDTDYDIYARQILSTGLPGGAALTIFSGSGQQQVARTAYGAGVYLIVWEDNQTNAVRGQLLQASGVLSGTDFPIGTGGADNNTPAIDFNPVTQEFLVTWARDNSGDNDVWAQRIAPSGQLLGSAIFVDGSGGQQLQPAVAHDNHGHYLVVYLCPDTGAFGICGQRVFSTGTLQGTGFSIYASTANSVMPDLAYDPQRHEYLVIWRDERSGVNDEIDAQRVGDDGVLIGSAFPVGTQSDEPYPPAVAYHPAAQAYVVLWNQLSGVSGWNVRSRTVWADGRGMDNPTSVVGIDGDQVYPALSKQGAGIDLYLLYTDHAPGYPDLYGQRYAPHMAYFTATPDSGYAPLSVQFHDRSTATPIDTRQWDFGDGTSGSPLADPAHVYPQPGEYTTVLTITAAGQTYHTAQTIQVADPDRTVINYTYDGLYRLTKADSTGVLISTFEYAYDAVGNRTAQTRTITSTQVTAYQYDAANRLASVNGQSYTWDDNGNLINDGEKAYTYNQANRLTNLTQGATTFQFNYNGDGARLRQVIAGVPTTYTQDLAAPLPVVLQSKTGANATKYVYALGTRPLAQYGEAWEYLLADALGSVRQIVDVDGNVTLAESYEPYGNVLSSNGTASSIFGYSGEQVDTFIKLLFLRARYYSPETARFLSKDVWQGDYTRPQSFNGGTYTENNPVNATDPSGMCKYQPGDPEGTCRVEVFGETLYDIALANNIQPWTKILDWNPERWDPAQQSYTLHRSNLIYLYDRDGGSHPPNPDGLPPELSDVPQPTTGWIVDGLITGGNWSLKFPKAPPGCPKGVVGGGTGYELLYDLTKNKVAHFTYDFVIYGIPTSGSISGGLYDGVVHGFSDEARFEHYRDYAMCLTTSPLGISSVKLGVRPDFQVGFCGPAQFPWELKGLYDNIVVPQWKSPGPQQLWSAVFGFNITLTAFEVNGPAVVYARYYGPHSVQDIIPEQRKSAIEKIKRSITN